jgi:acyl dehydratase
MFEEFVVGESERTMGRTVTETDIVNFVGIGGIFEELFVNAEFEGNRVLGGRVAPAMLVLTIAEGLYIHTGHTHAGRAFLGLDNLRLTAPTKAGDTLWVVVTVDSARPSKSRPGHGVVQLSQRVENQRGETVLTYTTTRLYEARGGS